VVRAVVERTVLGMPAGKRLAPMLGELVAVTDIATGWTENRSVPDKTAKCVLAALNDIAAKLPFPILGVDSDNGSEFINVHLLQWCQGRQITSPGAAGQQERRPSCRAEEPAMTPPRSCCYSTRSGSCSPS
jgi:hypothetical protein